MVLTILNIPVYFLKPLQNKNPGTRHHLNEVEGNELITSILDDNISCYFNDRMLTVMSVQNKGSFKYLIVTLLCLHEIFCNQPDVKLQTKVPTERP